MGIGADVIYGGKLQVESATTTGRQTALFIRNGNGSGESLAGIKFQGGYGSLFPTSAISAIYGGRNSAGSDSRLEFHTQSAAGGLTERMRIRADGSRWTNANTLPAFECRAWVNFDGTTSPGTIRASGNVSSVTRPANGKYTVNFATAMPDANYATNVSSRRDTTFDNTIQRSGIQKSGGTYSTTAVSVVTGGSDADGFVNHDLVCVSIFR